jgi:hypothetical protein
MKIALPATLAAIPFVGGHAAGIAAFGGALGVPVLLLVFLGAAGITSIIEAVVRAPEARTHIAEIIDVIIEDERLRRTSAQMKAAMKDQPMDPTRFPMPVEEMALRQYLLSMDPFDFEHHSMSFFQGAGFIKACVTPKSNDFGLDGWALHDDGLVVETQPRIKLADQPFSNLREWLKNRMLIVGTSSPRLRLQRKQLLQPRWQARSC